MTMTTSPPATGSDRLVPATQSPQTRRWIVLAVLSAAVILAAGFWWNSMSPENCFRRGQAAIKAGNRRTAVRESLRLLKTPGYESHGRLLSGLLYLSEGQPAEALPELQLAAHDNDTAVEALTGAAQCYYLLGRLPETVNVASAALQQDPDALDARRWRVAAYYDLGAADNALADLAEISLKAPLDPRPDRLLGLIHKDFGEYAVAIDHYHESLRRDPRQRERPEILEELASSLAKLSRWEEALEALRDCERTPSVLTLRAECAQNLGQAEEADELLQQALKIDPNYLDARLERAALLLLESRAAEAVDFLEDTVRQAPYSSQAHFYLSQAYRRTGAEDKAEAELQLRHETEKVEREFSNLNDTASQKPIDPEVRYQLGVLARKLGKKELATVWFRAALALSPNHAAARAALAEEEQKAP
jgi:tetratricopeptide (TPR) repeat protein